VVRACKAIHANKSLRKRCIGQQREERRGPWYMQRKASYAHTEMEREHTMRKEKIEGWKE
jgi:hypothetical protein